MSNFAEQTKPFNGEFAGRHILSMHQFTPADIDIAVQEARAARIIYDNPSLVPPLLQGYEQKAVMRQPSTRTGGSMATAMNKLGGNTQVISGMEASSEGKGESRIDSAIAFATQADVISTRTYEVFSPHETAWAIDTYADAGKLWRRVPVINNGDGTNEHPTQTIGDLYTICQKFGGFSGLTLAIVGDHERYRAHRSLLIAAATLGMKVVAVESRVVKVPQDCAEALGDNLQTTRSLDEAMRVADVLYIGRRPEEYSGKDAEEKVRSARLALDYEKWRVNRRRLQRMSPDSILLHPRPRGMELDPDVDFDPRAWDVRQMEAMIPARMGLLALVSGKSIKDHLDYWQRTTSQQGRG